MQVTVPAAVFSALYANATEKTRHYIDCVRISDIGGKIALVATDGKIAAVYVTDTDTPNNFAPVSVRPLAKLPKAESLVIDANAQQINILGKYDAPLGSVPCKINDGEFPQSIERILRPPVSASEAFNVDLALLARVEKLFKSTGSTSAKIFMSSDRCHNIEDYSGRWHVVLWGSRWKESARTMPPSYTGARF